MSLRQVRKIIRPKTIEEAWAVRVEEPETSRFLAGGVDLVLYAPPAVTTLIDLSRLGLAAIVEDGEDLRIGAMSTLTQVLESPLVAQVAGGFLVDVLHRVASPLQRNLATLGGAAVRAHSWSDVVPALLVLDAQFEAFNGREVVFDLADGGSLSQGVSPLVRSIRVPGAWRSGRAAWEKFARTAFDVALLNCACAVRVERGVCREARVAVGGTPSLARRIAESETLLAGKRLTAETARAAAAAAARAIDARDDRRATAAYRRRLAEIGVRRCLERIASMEEAG